MNANNECIKKNFNISKRYQSSMIRLNHRRLFFAEIRERIYEGKKKLFANEKPSQHIR